MADSKNEYTLSLALIKDAAEIISFLNKIGGETEFLTFGQNEFFVSLNEEKKIIKDCLETEKSLMLIAKARDEIVAQLFLERCFRARVAHMAEVSICVAKSHWGQSIGRNMMLMAIEWAKIRDITKLQLRVRCDNLRAINLYKSLGFDVEGHITRSLRIEGIYYDDFMMGLII
jgi:RimJ/RimL family protein N-acetyltransferase